MEVSFEYYSAGPENMITFRDIARTTKDTDAKGFSLCFHCGKEIKRKTYSMRISHCFNHSQIFLNDDKLFKYVDFHIECWKEIAGEEYMFSS